MLLRRAGGNPFYLGELVRALLANKCIERDQAGGWRTTSQFAAVPLPDTIEGLILARIDRLDDEAKQVLKTAAVVGRTFFYRVLKSNRRFIRHEGGWCLAPITEQELGKPEKKLGCPLTRPALTGCT